MSLTDKPTEKLARGSYFLILESISNVALGAIFWVILAKMIDASSLGQVMVSIALATTIIGFAGFGVRVTISKYMAEYNARNMPDTARTVLMLGLKLALIVSGVAAVLVSLLSGHIANIAYHDPSLSSLLTLAVITYLPSQTIVVALMGAFQGSQRMEYSFITFIIYEIARVAIAVLLVLNGLSSFGVLVAFSIASVIAALVSYIYFIPRVIKPKSHEEGELKNIKHIIKFSGMNYFAVGMRTVSAQIGVLILGTQNFEWAAFYGISVMIANVVGGFSSAISRALLPTASEEWAKGNKTEFGKVFNATIRLSLLLSGFGFMIFMIEPSYILGLLSESYVEASSALRILVVASIINAIGMIMISMLNAANRASIVAKIGLLSSASTVALTAVLVPLVGIDGAALAMLGGSLFALIPSIIMLKEKEKMSISLTSVYKPSVSILVGLMVGYSLYSVWDNVIVALAVSVLSYSVFSMLYRAITRTELKALFTIVIRSGRA